VVSFLGCFSIRVIKSAKICEICGLKRFFDLALAGFLLCLLSVSILVVGLVVRLTSEGPVLYWSERVGIDNQIFRMPKFRTMRVDNSGCRNPSHEKS